jgi:hypothetical protein
MLGLFTTLIIELINVTGTLVAAIIMRWLLGLSTYEKDMIWMKSTNVYKFVDKLKFYRGKELIHQLRAWHVYSSSNS